MRTFAKPLRVLECEDEIDNSQVQSLQSRIQIVLLAFVRSLVVAEGMVLSLTATPLAANDFHTGACHPSRSENRPHPDRIAERSCESTERRMLC